MIPLLKKHFIPHDSNDHRPHFLRKNNIKNILILILFLEIFTFLIPTLTHINKSGGMAAVLPAVLTTLTNEERQSQNLGTLTINPLLVKAAEMKAQDMATKGYFAHTSPEGKTPWYWIEQVGYKYQYAGENLAINFNDSKDVTNAWMNSPSHRANIVKDKYTEVGTGVATGIFEGRETLFVAQVYANPLIEKPVVNSPSLEKTIPINTKTVKKAEPVKTVAVKEPVNILGAENIQNEEGTAEKEIVRMENPTFWQKIFSSPRNTTNIILYVIYSVVALALLLYIFIRGKNHHRDLITNGLVVLVIIGALFVINYYISNHNSFITQSIDYSNEQK